MRVTGADRLDDGAMLGCRCCRLWPETEGEQSCPMCLGAESARDSCQAAVAALSCQKSMKLVVGGRPPIKVACLVRRLHESRFCFQPIEDFILGCRRSLQRENFSRHSLQRDGEFVDFPNVAGRDGADEDALSRLNFDEPLRLQTDNGFVHGCATHAELSGDIVLSGLIA